MKTKLSPMPVRLTPRARRILDALSKKLGVSRASVIEMLIREKSDEVDGEYLDGT